MIIWFFITLLSFYVMYWVMTKPCLKKVYIDNPNKENWRKQISAYKPFGIKLWQLFLMIIVAIIPIVNIIGIVVAIIVFFAQIDINSLDWDEVFPKGPDHKPNKFIQFLNKEIGTKK